ncbi:MULTISPECIES: IS3 family transposase [unclassified Mesorhizobium]|uniref:IS3 family transposase n=1 Tax=Mesorhizobium sp. LNJC372A00 TaxID=1287256 RepID=UPI000A0425C3
MSDQILLYEEIAAICNEFEHYGWRRVRAGLRQKGMIVNHKKIRRLMREHDLQPRMRQRYTVTTDSDHNQPIFPNLARDIICDGPNQLWVADITDVTRRRLCLCCRCPGCLVAAGCRIRHQPLDRRTAQLAGLTAAVEGRKPPSGCVHHSDRGSHGGLKRSSQQGRFLFS